MRRWLASGVGLGGGDVNGVSSASTAGGCQPAKLLPPEADEVAPVTAGAEAEAVATAVAPGTSSEGDAAVK
jgi:hypothetical protein